MRTTLLLLAAMTLTPIAHAAPCPPPGARVPPGANTADPAAPFFVDTKGLDLGTSPPTRDPANPAYPHATLLADGTLPPAGAEGNFVIGPSHPAAPETAAQDGVPQGRVTSFTLTSENSVIYRQGCRP